MNALMLLPRSLAESTMARERDVTRVHERNLRNPTVHKACLIPILHLTYWPPPDTDTALPSVATITI